MTSYNVLIRTGRTEKLFMNDFRTYWKKVNNLLLKIFFYLSFLPTLRCGVFSFKTLSLVWCYIHITRISINTLLTNINLRFKVLILSPSVFFPLLTLRQLLEKVHRLIRVHRVSAMSRLTFDIHVMGADNDKRSVYSH